MNEIVPGFTTTDFRDRPNQCPHCAYEITATGGQPGERSPEPGSVSICFQCGAISFFDENLRLRRPTDEEYRELMRSEQWPMIWRMSNERKQAWDALPELGKRIVADVEKQWGWIRGPRPASIVVKSEKPRRKE